jgi:hypothetical protein
LLSRHPFYLNSQTFLAHFFKNISTNCCHNQVAAEVQKKVDGKDDLDSETTSLVLNTVFNTFNNEFEHESLNEAVRLFSAYLICQSIDDHIPAHKCSIPGLS